LAGNVTYAHYLDLLHSGERMVSFLPLAHAYGCAFDFLYAMSAGVHTVLLGKTPSPKILLQAFAEYRPSLVVTVPLVIEKMYKKIILPQLEKPALKLALGIPILNQKIYAKIRQKLIDAFGGNFNEIIIGGAAFNSEVEAFLYKIKFPFTVGYGMTECAPLISYDHHYEFVSTSCGQILKDIMELRVDSPDPYNILGEIQVRGENVMKGYYKNPEATKNAFTEDGWLRTGDLGTIDHNNRIFLRGRSKTMILSSNGQNVFPEEIEARLNNMPYVAESLVVSRNNKLVALVYPDYEAMDASGLSLSDLTEIMESNRQNLNKMVSAYENVSSIHIYPNEFEKTPKKSIKRYLYST
jgi:long-chain acyl-CoA synthetase